MNRKVFFVTLMFVILACGFPSPSVPVEIPQQPVDMNALQTIIVQTADAAQTQTAIANPTFTSSPTITPTRIPSITPTPTVTFIYILPSLTPIPTITPIGFIPSGATSEVNKFKTPVPWSCLVVGTEPPKGATLQKELKFYAFWKIKNTGTSTWTRNTIDLVYKGGYRHEGTRIQDTKEFVPPGDILTVSAFFIAPKNPGEYQSFFTLQVGKYQFCGMKISFVIKE